MSQITNLFIESGTGTVSTLSGNTGAPVSPIAGDIILFGLGSIDVTPSSLTLNQLNISVAGGGLRWTTVTTAVLPGSGDMSVNNGYIIDYAGLSTLLLPSTSAVGSIIELIQLDAGVGSGLVIDCNGKSILDGIDVATSSYSYTNIYDSSGVKVDVYGSVKLVCVSADSVWNVVRVRGSNWIAA